MKKLLYTFLVVSIIFTACEEEDAAPNTNNNNNSALAIGDTHQGGIVFWLDIYGGGFIASPADQGVFEWGCSGILISGADGTAIGMGNQNTIDIEAGCPESGTAAEICANLTLGGYSDWFLPSKNELNEMYLNIGHGNALGLGNIGGFSGGYYWNSSEYGFIGSSTPGAWRQSFTNGSQQAMGKNIGGNVRAVRAF